jgi:hypothetical protein
LGRVVLDIYTARAHNDGTVDQFIEDVQIPRDNADKHGGEEQYKQDVEPP